MKKFDKLVSTFTRTAKKLSELAEQEDAAGTQARQRAMELTHEAQRHDAEAERARNVSSKINALLEDN